MATSFPSGLDSFTNPTAVDTLDSPPHDTQHADANDAIEALQAKVGVDSSAVTTSLDYRVAQLETGGGGMTVSSTAPSSPVEGDMWYDDTSGRTYVYYDDGSSQQWVEFGAPPSGIGKILQVVSTAKTDTFSASLASGNFSAVTGLSASITPASASNKILVTTHLHLSHSDAYGTGSYRIMRGATPVGVGDLVGSRGQQTAAMNNYKHDNQDIANVSMTFLDSPATTSATTYSVEWYMYNTLGPFTLHLNRSNGDPNNSSGVRPISTITVMEVAA